MNLTTTTTIGTIGNPLCNRNNRNGSQRAGSMSRAKRARMSMTKEDQATCWSGAVGAPQLKKTSFASLLNSCETLEKALRARWKFFLILLQKNTYSWMQKSREKKNIFFFSSLIKYIIFFQFNSCDFDLFAKCTSETMKTRSK